MVICCGIVLICGYCGCRFRARDVHGQVCVSSFMAKLAMANVAQSCPSCHKLWQPPIGGRSDCHQK